MMKNGTLGFFVRWLFGYPFVVTPLTYPLQASKAVGPGWGGFQFPEADSGPSHLGSGRHLCI